MGPQTDREWTDAGALIHQILLVEDDPDQAASLKELLETQGYRVQIAKDGGQAQAAFVMWKPDLVLLDVILPGESGFEVCERFKKHDRNIPIIFVSAIDQAEARSLGVRVGGNAFLVKPFEIQSLIDEIARVCEENWARLHDDPPKEEGRVRFFCRCGKKFKVSVAHRGKAMTCPECGEPVIVPRHD